MTDEIIKLLDELAKRFGIVIDWTSDTVMPYLTELFDRFISYQIMIEVIWLVLMVIVLGLGVVFLKFAIKMYKDEDDNIMFEVNSFGKELTLFGSFSIMFVVVAELVFLTMGFISLFKLLKLLYIPEMAAVEWLSNRIR